MEIDPDLQFKHYTVSEAQLPADALAQVSHVSLAEVEICCDLDHHVYNRAHTDSEIAQALRDSHWFDLDDWVAEGHGADNGASPHAA